MIKDKNIFFIGVFILATQYLFGLPSFWKSFLITIAALFAMFLSVKIVLPVTKKPIKSKSRREKVTPVFVESSPVYPKDNTVESAESAENTNQLPK
jgi:hypothetical protein